MSNAIEILKKIFETNKSVMFEDEKEALKKGILALEQKENLVKWLEKEIAENEKTIKLAKSEEAKDLFEIRNGQLKEVLDKVGEQK